MSSCLSLRAGQAQKALAEHPALDGVALEDEPRQVVVACLAMVWSDVRPKPWASLPLERLIADETDRRSGVSRLARTLLGCLLLVNEGGADSCAQEAERWLASVDDWDPVRGFVASVRGTLLLADLAERWPFGSWEAGFESGLADGMDSWHAVIDALGCGVVAGVPEAHYNLALLSSMPAFSTVEHLCPMFPGAPEGGFAPEGVHDYVLERLASAEEHGMDAVLGRWRDDSGPALPRDPLFLPSFLVTELG